MGKSVIMVLLVAKLIVATIVIVAHCADRSMPATPDDQSDDELTELVQTVGGALDEMRPIPDAIGRAVLNAGPGSFSSEWQERLTSWQDGVEAQFEALLIPYHDLAIAILGDDDVARERILGQVTAVWQAVGGIEASMITSGDMPAEGLPEGLRDDIGKWADKLGDAEHNLTMAIGILGGGA